MVQEIRLKVHTSGMGVKTEVSARNHRMVIDESPAMGGANAGPNPLEYVLAALAGCEEVIAQGAAKQLGFQLDGIDFDVEGVIDPRGLIGQPDVLPYFQSVTIRARVKTTEHEARIHELQELVDKRCPVFTLIQAAGVPVDTKWEKAQPKVIQSEGLTCDVDGNC